MDLQRKYISVLFFTTQDFNFLSDHSQIKLIIKCNITQDNSNFMTNWRENKGYRWTSESKLKIIEALSDENVKNKIINFEIKNFAEDQYGIDTATEELNLVFEDIANKSCKFIHVKKKSKERKVRQKWSDISVYEQKKSLNFLGKQLRKNPYNNQLKQKYFYQLKCFRKIVKQKKYAYKQHIFDQLSDSMEKNPAEFWKILKSLDNKKLDQNSELKELFNDIEKTVKHVQDQGRCKNNNETFKNQIDEKLQSLEKNICFNPETDDPITIKEIKFVLNKLKNGKAGGPDGIINEVIKYSCNITLKSVAKLFNLILKSGQYPKQWNKSYMILLHKSGSKSDPSNYRGISLVNCLSKVFSAILNQRLCTLMSNKYAKTQFGFRENHRTSDSLFVLKTLINKYVHKNKRKLFVCFVDLQKAFDSVWRNGLLFKLVKIGVGKQLYNIVKQQLSKTETAFKFENSHSHFFQIHRG